MCYFERLQRYYNGWKSVLMRNGWYREVHRHPLLYLLFAKIWLFSGPHLLSFHRINYTQGLKIFDYYNSPDK